MLIHGIIWPYVVAPSCRHDAKLTPMIPCHRCHPECPLWHAGSVGSVGSHGQFARREIFRFHRLNLLLAFISVVFHGVLFDHSPTVSLPQLSHSCGFWSFRVWSLITFMHDRHRSYLPCICMQAGAERSGLVLMVSQSTELVLSIGAAQLVKRACGFQTLRWILKAEALIFPMRVF